MAALTVIEAASVFMVKPQTVRHWIATGKCDGMYWRTPGGHVRFDSDAIERVCGAHVSAVPVRNDTVKSVLKRHYAPRKAKTTKKERV